MRPFFRKVISLWAPQVLGFGGGISEFSRELISALSTQYTMFIVTKFDRSGLYKGMPIHGAGGCYPPLRGVFFCLQCVVKVVFRRPTLVISTHLNFGPVAFWLCRCLGINFIIVAHGIDIHPNLSLPRQRALRSAVRVIGVSRHSRDLLLQLHGIRADQVRILHNTLDSDRFTVGIAFAGLRNRYQIPLDRKIVLTVGRLAASEAYKGYDIILKIFRRVLTSVPDAHYVLCGKGDDRPRIERLIAELGLEDRVTLTGFVSDDELPAHYCMADVFAMPSTGEGFGIVFLEAMACGIPVLAGNRDGSVDALADGELGCLVDPLSVDEVAAGLISLLQKEGPEFWFQPEQLRSRMLARFGRDEFRKKLLQIIEEVIDRKNAASDSVNPHHSSVQV